MSTFSGFTSADFDAYAQKKWKSNVFTRERLDVKQKLIALGRELQGSLSAADGSPLAVEPSVEYPALWNHKQVEAQHIYFSRNEGARKELDTIIDKQISLASMIDDPTPQRNHLFLVASVTNNGLEIALKLHPDARIDRQNLERKCEDHFEREKFIHLVRDLESARVGVPPVVTPVADLDDTRLNEILATLAKAAAPLGVQPLLGIVQMVPRERAIELGAAILDETKRLFAKLLPIYKFVAWSRDNDFVLMRETLQKEKQARRQKGLAKHDQVRIVRGMFAGKTGVVQEIDQKGGVKLLVGKIAVKLDAEDVAK